MKVEPCHFTEKYWVRILEELGYNRVRAGWLFVWGKSDIKILFLFSNNEDRIMVRFSSKDIEEISVYVDMEKYDFEDRMEELHLVFKAIADHSMLPLLMGVDWAAPIVEVLLSES